MTSSSADGRDPAPGWRSRLLAAAHVWLPCLVLVVLAAPSITFMLPACEDYLDEIDQPIQALKFFKTHGQAFHKYGPMPNFILAPAYGVSLACWKLTGELGKPSEDFPYGLSRPFEQIGLMILEGRVVFLALSIACFGYLAHTLRLLVRSRLAILFAMLLCVATDSALVSTLPTPRPDAPMLAFAAAALAVWVRIVTLGFSTRRGIVLALLAVFAVSSKELAAALFVLPYVSLAWIAFRIPAARRPYVVSVVTGVVAYALLDVVYAPATWMRRMGFWIGGPGIDASVWGGTGPLQQLVDSLGCLLDNLGPAGSIVASVAIVACVVGPDPRRWRLLLPLVSVVVLGVAPIHYPEDRFFTIVAVALVPLVALGLDRILRARLAVVALTLAAIVNLWFATFTWHKLQGIFEYSAERHALAHVDRSETIGLLSIHPLNAGSTRLDLLGFRLDPASIQVIAAEDRPKPTWIYAPEGVVQFLEDARELPQRAKMIEDETGFDVSRWGGLESLGYRLESRTVPSLPGWFAFGWMPAVRQWDERNALCVYRRER